jgi:hypothetical protein
MTRSASPLCLLLAFGALFIGYQATAQSNGTPSAKATAAVGDINVVSGPATDGEVEGPWTTVMSNTLKTANMKDLFVDVSLECGLFTSTKTASKGGNKDTSTSSATIQVRVLVDGQEAYPGSVTFAHRNQELSATFQGLLTGALSVDPDTGTVIIDEDLLQPEEVELIQDTMSANSFNFVLDDLSSGAHTIEVQARIDLGASAQAGSSVAKATIGRGSMTVEEVRMVKNEDILF